MELRDHDYVSNVRDAFFFFTSSFGQSENARTLGKGRAGGPTDRTARECDARGCPGDDARRDARRPRTRMRPRSEPTRRTTTTPRRRRRNDRRDRRMTCVRRRRGDRRTRFVFPRVFRCLFVRDDDDVGGGYFQRRARDDAASGFADRGRGGELGEYFFRFIRVITRLTTPDRSSSFRAGIRAPRVAFSVIRKRAEPDHASGGVPRGRVRAGVVPHGSSRERFRVALARSARVQFPGQVRRVAFVIRGRDEIRPPAPRIGFRAPIASPPGDRRLGSDFSCDSDLGVWVYVYMVYSYLVYTWDGFHARTVSNELTWNPRRARRETED